MLYGDEKDKGCADVALTLSECLERKIRHAALLEYGRKVNAAIDELISLDHVNAFLILSPSATRSRKHPACCSQCLGMPAPRWM